MTMYVSHPGLSRDAWNLRRYVLYLHDLTNRKRFLTASKPRDDAFFGSYAGQKAARIGKIRRFAESFGLPEVEVTDLIKGRKVFVDGSRGPVREAGWDVDFFEFDQSYLSAFVHSHPVSFMRAEERRISFRDPSDYQLSFCGFALGIAADLTCDVKKRRATFSVSGTGATPGQVAD